MIREIKFRQRIKATMAPQKDYWHYWGYGIDDSDWTGPIGTMEWDERPSYQYTGLKDKNGKGKEVWAGDIISHRNIDKIETDGVVHFDWRGACIIVSGGYVRLDMIPNWKVIGNIEENPELLKGGKDDRN